MEPLAPEMQEQLRRLAEQQEYATETVDYPLWLLQQTQDVLLDLLRGSAIQLTVGLAARLARWTYGAALVSRCLVERVTVEQARRAVLSPALHGLLLMANRLPRVPPATVRFGPRERKVLAEYGAKGCWRMDRPARLVEAVRDAVYEEALARLSAADALLVGLVPVAGGVAEALRLLDLDEQSAQEALSAACGRLEQSVRRVVAERLRGERNQP